MMKIASIRAIAALLVGFCGFIWTGEALAQENDAANDVTALKTTNQRLLRENEALREELDLLEQYVEGVRAAGPQNIPSLTSHLPGTYRGGMVARLQRLLVQEADGTFHP